MSLKVHNDDISHVLIHSKKAISNQETQLFKTELEKFRPLQVRLLQANHKQSSVFKELTRMYSDLLKDKRVRSEQNKYELYSRQRGSVMNQYRKIHQAFTDLQTGLERAQKFYSDMHSTVESQAMNVDSFVGNRKAEGGELLGLIEQKKAQGSNGQGNADTARLQAMMGRMNIGSPSATPPMKSDFNHRQPPPPPQQPAYSGMPGAAYPGINAPQALQSQGHGAVQPPRQFQQQPGVTSPVNPSTLSPRPTPHTSYNPGNYTPLSPPTSSQSPHMNNGFKPVPPQPQYGSGMYPQQGFVLPPPPSGPPPGQMYGAPSNGQYNQQTAPQYGQAMPQSQAQQADPWAALSGWK